MNKDNNPTSWMKNHCRLWIRIGIVLLVTVLLLWWQNKENLTSSFILQVNKQTVLDVYCSEYAPNMANGRILKEIGFSQTFSGGEKEAFYVVWQKEDGNFEIEKYYIIANESERGYGFQYKNSFENLNLPPQRFVLYTNQNGQWQQKN